MNSALALQEAIHAQLLAAGDLITLLGGASIFDDVPQDTAFPYVTLGDIETFGWYTQTQSGNEHIITLHVWSSYQGRAQVHGIIGEIDKALDGAQLTLAGHALINLRVIFWTALRDLDGETYHGIIRLRAVTEPTA